MIAAELLDWLLAPENPSARYLTLRDLLGRPDDDPEVRAARAAIPAWGSARSMLEAQWPAGYWMQPGVGYSPKHRATVWQVIFLAALGVPPTAAIERACAYVLDHSRLPDGRFSAYKTARGAILCLNGNLLRAMFQLGYRDARLGQSLEALAGMVLSDGFCCRYNAAGPPPARMGEGLPCAWGAVKALAAFARLPEGQRSPAVRDAVRAGVEFLLEGDLAGGGFPTATTPSPLWHSLGFPLGYTSNLLEALAVLARLGRAGDPRLAEALEIVRRKQDGAGRWRLEYAPRNSWADWGAPGRPNKWLTLRALYALEAAAWQAVGENG